MWEEDRDYLISRLQKPSSPKHPFQYKGSYRPDDALFFFADRQAVHGAGALEKREKNMRSMYEDKKEPSKSIHAQGNWLSVLATNDKYATAGREGLREAERLKEAFSQQGQWVSRQQKLLEQKRKR